jgi:outer membrane lipoprotein carrier protein
MALGRFSRRRLRAIERSRVLAVAFVLVLAASDAAVAQGERAATLTGVELLDRFLDEVATLEAGFEQELSTADGRLIELQSGSLALLRPSRFRWHYLEPFEQLVIADGKNLWIYDIELEQITVTPLDDTVTSSPAMLLSGDHAVRDGFTAVEGFSADGLQFVRLEPEIDGTDFRSVLIGFHDVEPRRLELVDGLGQTTRIELFDVRLNGELEESAFRFEPPEGADVIGTPAD